MRWVLPAITFVLGALFFRACIPYAAPPELTIRSDTVVIRDTIRMPVPKPEVITVVRYDTLRLQMEAAEGITPDPATVSTTKQITPENGVIIPITRNTYKTEDYTAVVEGYRPRLISMELYPKTTTITNTITKIRSPRWALTVGPGVGYGPKGVQPYIGITVGFVLWSR